MGSSEGADELTRKQRREAARERRRELERQANVQAARRKRLSMLGAAAVVVAAIVVIAIVVSSSGGGASTSASTKPGAGKNAGLVSQVSTLLNGVPQNGVTLGQPNAPVTLDYYGDLECPICRDFTLETLPQVITNLVRPGKIKVVYRAMQTATQNPQTFLTQQVAALAAGKQNKAWDYIELFYHQQGQEDTDYVTEAYLDGLAQQVPGLNLAAWQSARNDPSLASAVKADGTQANSLGLNATPTFVALGPKGNKGVTGAVPYSSIASLVQSVR